jgi:hypothetical protein
LTGRRCRRASRSHRGWSASTRACGPSRSACWAAKTNGQEFAFAVDASTVGADGAEGELLRAIGRLLKQLQEREDPDPLRAQRTPGFDLALIAPPWRGRRPSRCRPTCSSNPLAS